MNPDVIVGGIASWNMPKIVPGLSGSDAFSAGDDFDESPCLNLLWVSGLGVCSFFTFIFCTDFLFCCNDPTGCILEFLGGIS